MKYRGEVKLLIQLQENECEDNAKEDERPIQREHSRETDMRKDNVMRRRNERNEELSKAKLAIL